MSKTEKFLKFLAIAEVFAPQALQFTKLAPIANQVRDAIMEAAQIPGASGADKLAHVVAITKTTIGAVNTQAGHIVVDPALSDTAIASAVGAAVDTVRLIRDIPHDALHPAVMQAAAMATTGSAQQAPPAAFNPPDRIGLGGQGSAPTPFAPPEPSTGVTEAPAVEQTKSDLPAGSGTGN